MLTGAEGARLEQIAAGRSSGLESEPSGVRGEIAKHLSTALNLSETEERFSATAAEYRKRLTDRAQAARDEAVAKSQDMQNALSAESAALLGALDAVVAQAEPVGSPQYELLNKPFLIWPSNSVDLEASEIVESNSRAKFRVRTEDIFTEA